MKKIIRLYKYILEKREREMFKKTIENNKEKFLNYLRKKSVERLTIMFIPHGNEKIYSFHLSFLTIIFLLFIFFSTFSISLYGYYRYKEISNKINELKKLYGRNYQNTYQVQTSLSGIQEMIKKNISKNLKNFYSFPISYNNLPISYQESFKYSSLELNKEIQNNRELAPNSKYLKATYIANGIKHYIKIQKDIVFSIHKSFIEQNNLIFTIPNGRPVEMHRFRDTSGYGLRLDPVLKNTFEFHSGIDMAGNPKENIYSTADGIVHKVFYDAGYGNTVIIKHPSNYYTLYAHLYQPLVRTNQYIKKGERIGLMGSSGRVTGTHLHYEVFLDDMEKVNPLPFVCLTDLVSYKCKNYNKNYNDVESNEF